MTHRPNILFVFPDQLSARWLPCYGNQIVQAPNLDRFAGQSVLFNRAYTNIPLCTPYRACLFTGRYPSQTGVRKNGMALPDGEKTLAHYLTDVGYETYYVGKWHLSGAPGANRWIPPAKRGGFNHFIGWESHHIHHYDGLIWRDDPDKPIELRSHETDGLTDIVCEELETAASGDGPFFMTVSYQAPHPPCTPPSEYRQPFEDIPLDDPPNTNPEAWFKKDDWHADYGVEEFRKRYFGEISHLDAAFGQILDALETNNVADNTIVIFTSDHGEMAGCHNLFGKGVMYDEAVRVPLLVRVPDRETVNTVAKAVSTVDLLPTILDLAGETPPEFIEGESFVSAMTSSSGDQPEQDVFIEYNDENCIIRGHIKVVTERDSTNILQYFNLANDPYEMHNLAEGSGYENPESMMGSLMEWQRRTQATSSSR